MWDDFDRFIRRMHKALWSDFERMFGDLEPEFLKPTRRAPERPGVRGFKIEIRDLGSGKPEVKVTTIGEGEAPIGRAEAPPIPRPRVKERPEIKPVTRMLETNAGKIERPSEVILTMQVSGVKEEDVEVRPFESAVEVIARRPSGEAYFATFELPPDSMPGEHSLEIKDGMLIIRVPRYRRARGIGR